MDPGERPLCGARAAADDVAIGLWRAVRGEPEHRFERDVPMKAAVVAKDEFIEIGVDMFAAQAVIRAQCPSFHQREGAMDPGQDNVGRHLADNARIVPVVPVNPG